jgi:hypothetical protein
MRDELEFDFDNYDEDDESENMPNRPKFPGFFLFGPRGLFQNSQIIPNISNRLLGTLFGKEYGLYLTDMIKNETNNIFLLECSKISASKSKLSVSLFDVYEYLNKSHYINFILSKEFDVSFWAYEGINISIHIADTDNNKYSKILIIAQTSNIPEYLFSNIIDSIDEKKVEIDSTLFEYPMMVHTIKSKSYYKPIITYDISLGFNLSQNVDFNVINLSILYDAIILKYINDAISTFYIGVSKDDIDKYGEKMLRLAFRIDNADTNKLLNIKMICMPSLYYSKNFDIMNKFICANNDICLLSYNPLNENCDRFSNLATFINKTSSSTVTQVLLTLSEHQGIVTEFCDEYYMINYKYMIFTLNRAFLGFNSKDQQDETKIFSNIKEIPSDSEYVYSYWKPSSKIIIDKSMLIYGFININTNNLFDKLTFGDIYDYIKNELNDIFGITSDDYNSGNLKTTMCYENMHISRILLFKFIGGSNLKDNKQDTRNKKFKFWRNKS